MYVGVVLGGSGAGVRGGQMSGDGTMLAESHVAGATCDDNRRVKRVVIATLRRRVTSPRTPVTSARSLAPLTRTTLSRPHSCATTAEKLEGTSRGVDADHLPRLPPFLSRLPLLFHPCFTHSLSYSSFRLPLNLALRSQEAL